MPKWAAEEGFVQNGEVQLHYVADGPKDGEPVLLLHGFPQFSYEWRYHLPRLAAEGYRVVAPDLRGYNLSDRPEGVEAYRLQNLLGDINAFYKEFGWQSANIVAHDWGGAVAWLFVTFYPQLVKRFVALDIPHPAAFRTALRSLEQMSHSWYIWFFQTPAIPERVFGGDIDSFIKFMMVDTARPNTFMPEDYRQYREMLSRPGQLSAAFNFYRANSTPANFYPENPQPLPPVQPPTLLVYGENDFAFVPIAWEETAKYCQGYFKSLGVPDTGHWIVEEQPEVTLQAILEHLRRSF